MPCTKCNSEFTLLTWKIKCSDCEFYYCSKCLRRTQGALYCDKCVILNKRPPDREKLMELRAKDLQDYLNKNHISTHGLVEKSELVELFYRRAIPVGNKKGPSRLANVLSGSVPNITFQTYLSTEVPFGQQNNVSVNTSVRTETYSDNPQPTSSTVSTLPNLRFYGDVKTSTPTPPSKYPKLSDFNSVEELNDLSVKQLKELLTLNRVDFKGCVEKSELLDRAQRLWNDNNQYKNKAFEEANVENLCKICMDAPLDCVLLECGHVATCIQCGKQLAECPICRQFVTRVVRTFKA
ncbi:hypothetical protein RI129_006866 [Pyrocoelia pectoralis]|uniref:RING-type domain-containing protein n=1 Tax=Pyrocoelia pectoralis TaxID=417401 RepID=A0AAN7VH54_9COLE